MENLKKYRFLEALDKIVGTDKKIKTEHSDTFYTRYTEDGKLINDHGGDLAWPSIVDQRAQIWEVEPEPIYVWGVCDKLGMSYLWEEAKDTERYVLEKLDLFSKDKPQKFKLVLVED